MELEYLQSQIRLLESQVSALMSGNTLLFAAMNRELGLLRAKYKDEFPELRIPTSQQKQALRDAVASLNKAVETVLE